jgi:hypothetical protein
MKSFTPTLVFVALTLTLGAGAVSLANPRIITLPADTARLKVASEPGYEAAVHTCTVCHSVDYISMQPGGKGKEFWAAEVAKMVNVYGATVREHNRPAIIDYLAHNY